MGVIILGMHRGGTSALTAMVHLLGFDAGPEDQQIGPTADNPKGYWELEPLREFNERLLIELGGRWSAPPSFGGQDLEALADGVWGEEATALFNRLLPNDEWVWKDPRLCLLLPFWRRVLGDELQIVMAVRHPEDVARSLQQRNDFSIPYGLALWERYQRRAMTDAAGLATHVVPYDALIDEADDTVAALAGFLTEHGYAVDIDRSRLQDILDPSIRHHHSQRSLTEAAAPTEQLAALYTQLSSITGEPPPTWIADLPLETPGLQLAFDEHARMARWADLSAQLRAGLEEVRTVNDTKSAELVATISETEVLLEDSRTQAADNWIEVRRLEAEHVDATEGREAVIESLEALIKERDGWKWGVLQQEAKPLARARRSVRRALVGDDE